MGFLDNSGDICLDAVITDAGRQRLARGDGSFKITQFALGDDEINYSLYSGSHASGSAYYDLEILQTPVLEAFTNNIASLNNKLLTIPRSNILYLPVMKMDNRLYPGTIVTSLSGNMVVLVDTDTENAWGIATGNDSTGVMFGRANTTKELIDVWQGLDTDVISQTTVIDSDLKETQYVVELDNRLAKIVPSDSVDSSAMEANRSFVDDDNIAQYYFSLATDKNYVFDLANQSKAGLATATIAGPLGTNIKFKLISTLDAQASDYMFNTFGQDIGTTLNGKTARAIKSTVVITGATTGYSITVPVAYVKVI